MCRLLGVFVSVYVIDRPIAFDATKCRAVILSAIGSGADYLIILDPAEFSQVLGMTAYGSMCVLPGQL